MIGYLESLMLKSIRMTRDFEKMAAIPLTCKLSEEHGEFSMAILHKEGYLKHKTLKEDEFGEAADIMNVLLAVLEKANPGMSPDDIMEKLADSMEVKIEKYRQLLNKK